MAYLKKVENAGINAFTEQITIFGEELLTGTNLKFTYCDLNDFTSRPYGNLFTSFNFPITNKQKVSFATSYTQNSFTYFNNINQIIVVEIPENKYGELIDGKTFKLSFPINSGGTESVVDCFGSYFITTRGETNIKNMDKQYADSRSESAYFGIDPLSNELLSSNIAYLFSNQVARPKLGSSIINLLSSSYTYTSSNSFINGQTVYITNKTVNFNFIQGKRYNITFKNIKNNVIGYETSENAYTNNVTKNTIVSIEMTFFNLEQAGSNTYDNSTNLRGTHSFIYNCGTSSSTINIQSQNIGSPSDIIDSADLIIDEIIIETGSWSRWSQSNKFITSLGSTSGKQPAKFTQYYDLNYDQPVGILYLDKGFAVITDPTLVQNFAYGSSTSRSSGYDSITAGQPYTGDKNFTQIYFTDANKASSIYNSIYTEFIQAVTCIAMPNEFFISNNPTFTEVYGEDGVNNNNNDPVYISEIGLYNQFGELIAIAKTSEPIPKDKFNIAAFNIQLKV